MGTFRGVAAAVAAGVLLSGCGAGEEVDETTTTSPIITETSANPWDLPIEQRPALFDPCAEIPIEAVEQGVGGPVAVDDLLHNHRPGELFSCGWKNDEVIFNVVGTWRSKDEFLADPDLVDKNTWTTESGRVGIRARDRMAQVDTSCDRVFFTSRGAVLFNAVLIDSLSEFKGEMFSTACEVLTRSMEPVLPYLPEGDF